MLAVNRLKICVSARFEISSTLALLRSSLTQIKYFSFPLCSNTLVYTTKNSQIWHSDGFVLKSRDGSIICSSDPDKSYNVRDIQVFEKSVYMLDAHNLVLWKLDLKDATVSKITEGQKFLKCQKEKTLERGDSQTT